MAFLLAKSVINEELAHNLQVQEHGQTSCGTVLHRIEYGYKCINLKKFWVKLNITMRSIRTSFIAVVEFNIILLWHILAFFHEDENWPIFVYYRKFIITHVISMNLISDSIQIDIFLIRMVVRERIIFFPGKMANLSPSYL